MFPRQDHFINVKQLFLQIFLNHSNPKQLAHPSESSLGTYFRSSDLENYDIPTPTTQAWAGEEKLMLLPALPLFYLFRKSLP